MRFVALLACVGCNYNPSAGVAPTDSDDPPDDTSTVTPDTSTDGPPDTPVAVPCETPDPAGLVFCYQFDGDLGALDDSSPNDLDDPTVTGLSAVTRTVNNVSSQAALIGTDVAARIEQMPILELTGDYTIVGWLMPINPSAGNDGILDHNGQWAFSVENQLLTCWWSRTGLLKSTIATSAQNWQLGACVITGDTGCVYRIDPVGGAQMSCRNDLTGNAPAGNSGVSIGSFQAAGGAIEQRFRGAIDDLRVYSRALTVDELCAIAGRTGC